MTQAYPLHWPAHTPRAQDPAGSQFKTSFGIARDCLILEIKRLGGEHAVLSANIALKPDGMPYANRPEPQDKGVAVYFQYNGKSMCFACDKWNKVGDNIQAIRKTIEAIRSIERWGSKDMLEAAFTGFVALPAPQQKRAWHEILGVRPNAPISEIKQAYHLRAKIVHPDKGGVIEQMMELNAAYKEALEA